MYFSVPSSATGIRSYMMARRLIERGHEVMLETGGSLPIDSVPDAVRRIIDVKCPGSGEAENNLWSNLDLLRPTDELKFVLADEADYEWAREVVSERDLLPRCPVLFSVVAGRFELRVLAKRVLADRLQVRVQTQLHKLIWGSATRGV